MPTRLLAPLLLTVVAGAAATQDKPAPAVPGAVGDQVDPKTAARQRALEQAKANPGPGPTSSKLDMRKLKTGAAQPSRPRTVTVPPEDANLSPEEVRAKYKERLGAAFVDYKSHCEPAVLAPGERGKIVLYFVLKNDAVMLAKGPMAIDFQAAQGELSLGPVQFQPAGKSRIAAAFRGKNAYDDFVVAEIPVVVDPAAKAGLQTVRATFDYELYNGTTAGWIEKFRDHVTAAVRVGNTEAPKAPAAAVPSAAAAAAGAGQPANAPQVDGTALAAGANGAAVSVGVEPASLEADGSPLFWVFVAAGAVLGAAAVLRLRRR